MPIATELAINTGATALTMAQTIFGNGATVTGATLTGATLASGTYSGADATLGGIAPGDSGIILSTGLAADFTNSDGTTNTNTTESGASTDNGTAGDTLLGTVSGQATEDAVILDATFTTTGDYITMLFTFSSEEYLEYVNGGVNDAFGVWVNNTYVPFTPATNDLVSIDTVNNLTASNLYVDNPIADDTYNTEMDGTTQTLSIKAPVNSGGSNTIRIALADGGDGIYDTNVLIAANSVQTIALAFDDQVTIQPNTATSVDVLSNDIDTIGTGLTITEINGTPVVVGGSVTLPTGEVITLNADNTLTILADADVTSEPFTYMVVDSAGNTDIGFITITTEASIPLNYIVEGTSGNDTIDATYALDPQGDRIDANDALDGSNDDSIQAGAGNDVVDSGAGNDTIDGGTGSDSVFAGLGNDSVIGGDGNDSIFGQGGNDTILGGEGADALDGDSGDDSIDGGAGNDTLIADDGNDTLLGGLGNDEIYASTGNNYIDGGADNDLVFGGGLADTILGGTGMDTIGGAGGNDSIDGGADADVLNGEAGNDTILGGTGNDTVSGGLDDDSIDGGDGADVLNGDDGNDTVLGGAGNDSVYGGAGDDSLSGGIGNDSMEAWIGNDTLNGGDGADYLDGSDGNDSLLGGEGNDTLLGGAGTDSLYGGAGSDVMSGGSGDDLFAAGPGDDTQSGGDGNDIFFVGDGFGNDVIIGGEGAELGGDTLNLSLATSGLTIDLSGADAEAGTVSDGTDTVTFSEIENIVLGAGNDTVVLADGSGDDIVSGFDAPTVDGSGNWTGTDQLDVTGMTDLNGALVNTDDVTVSDTNGDGTGDAILTFPNGESITLTGVASTIFADPEALEAIGIPMPNYIVEGTAGNDLINAGYIGDPEGDMVDDNDNATGTNADSIIAGAGNDTVISGADNDTISGGDGADIISGGAGNDSIFGDADDDLLYGGEGADTIDGGAGNDYLQGAGGADSLVGGAGNDDFDGGDDNDTIEGGIGDDTIEGDAGDDSLDGGTGNDSIWGGTGNDTISGGDGNDVINAEAGIDEIDGGAGADSISLTSGNDTVVAGDDNDTVLVSAGGYANGASITVDGGTGGVDNDTLDLSAWTAFRNLVDTPDADTDSTSGVVEVQDASGNWITVNFTEIETLLLPATDLTPDYIVEGTVGNDTINGSYTGDPEGDMVDNNDHSDGSNDDSIVAGAGNDVITAGTGNDTIDAGADNDTVYANAGDDFVLGGGGNDLIFGFDGADTVLGGDGADIINGMTGADSLDGGNDNDTFVVENNFGADVIVGGEGVTTGTDDDLVRANSVSITDPITVLFSGNEEGTLSDGTDTLNFSEIERLLLGNNGDTVTATATTSGINVNTSGGDDSVLGGSGADTIVAGAGNDTIVGGAGADSITTGTGDDEIEVGQGDTVTGGDGDDTFTLVDLGEPGAANITINGNEGGETLGDTLDLNGQADRTTLNITNPVDVAGGLSGTIELLDGSVVSFNNIENIICFVPGTSIATPAGLRNIEDLRVGDPVVTQDNGLQRIGWIGKTTVPATDRFAPVHFKKSVWPGATSDLTVSPQHRMLIKGYRAELLFGQSEVLVPAVHMIDGKDVVRQQQDTVTYIHIMFEQHEIIFANGIAAESFHPGSFSVDTLADQARFELFELFPELRSNIGAYGATARMSLKAKEAKLLTEYA